MEIDLHTHSSVSDGTEPPAQVMVAAVRAGLDVVALTDHDTIGGWPEAAEAAEELGIGLVRGGAGTALVGSHEEIAERIEEYHRLGIDEFILSGYPHLEEAYWFGEGVLPILAERGSWTNPAPVTHRASVPFGASEAAS